MRTIISVCSARLLSLAICFSLISITLLLAGILIDHWELGRFDEECVTSKNSSEVSVQTHSDFFTVQMKSLSPSSPGGHTIYKLHNLHAGIWRICNRLSGRWNKSLRSTLFITATDGNFVFQHINKSYIRNFLLLQPLHILDVSQNIVYGDKDRCLGFMADYSLIKQSLSQDTVFIIRKLCFISRLISYFTIIL